MDSLLHGKTRLSLIKKEGRIKEAIKQGKYAQVISDALKEIPDISEFRCDVDLLLLVCSVVETLVPKNHNVFGVQKRKGYTDKKKLVLDIFDSLFSLVPEEKDKLSNEIDTFVSRGLIKKPSLVYTILSSALLFFFGCLYSTE